MRKEYRIKRNLEISFEFGERPYYAVTDSDIEEVDTIHQYKLSLHSDIVFHA